MLFDSVIGPFEKTDFNRWAKSKGSRDIEKALNRAEMEVPLSPDDFISLISDSADHCLEDMARIARRLTLRHFGKAVVLYRPIYISNYCTNHCIYCGFNHNNEILRRHLNLQEIEAEARVLREGGVKQIILLTGEAPQLVTREYLAEAVTILCRYFDSVSLEVYPMETEDYRILKQNGVDGLTIYQETYDRQTYAKVHPAGAKRDFNYRLLTPDRAAMAGLRSIGIGALYGLSHLKREAFFTALHARHLMNTYLDTEVSISMPRINPAPGGFQPKEILDDRSYVRFLLAFRLFLPQAGINISTRECASFRDNLLSLGVTKISAESKTSVGGYSSSDPSDVQFELEDTRTVHEVMEAVSLRGLQPVLKDWEAVG